ncbi:hypothetical protein MLD38_020868 [Melastoma candidum]|uniref:Uncharacterized protein n=1 Tax=Melastoma candidum TaxID=119954 RepID=A0ACB9QDU1_9MYRT|nr:hypothetical protein MLD38_020868 [Melastoma candidum]
MGEKGSAGEEKLLAVARHIARTLGRDDSSAADDILQIFSNFDGRFSRDRLNPLDDSLHLLRRHISSDDPIWSSSSSAASFLHSLDHLISSLSSSSPTPDDGLVDLLHQAMFRLEDEFRSLMEIGTDSFEPCNNYDNNDGFDSEADSADGSEGDIPVAEPVTDFDVIIDALPSGTIGDLHEMAKRMVGAGFGKECCHVYSSCRREFLDESMSRLGLHRFSIEEARTAPWNELEEEIDRWTKAAAVSLRVLFPSERRLCDRIFHGLPSAADLSFMESCRGCTIQLLNFADSVAIGSRAPERLFKVLDVFEMLRDLMPEFEILFSDPYCILLRNEAIVIWKRLGEAIRGIFMELENLIRRDPAKAAVPGGGLHPITRYVMNYLRAACRSRQTLELVFEDADDPRGSSSSSLSVQLIWIMELLESNLEAKSKVYRDNVMSSMFMMNNEMYLVLKVKDDELGSLLGEDWIRKHTAKVKQYQNNFVRGSWSKALGALKLDNVPNADAKSLLIERVKTFNTAFDEACESQASFAIFDEQLKEEVRSSIAKLLLPAYEGFVGRLQSGHEIRKHHMANVRPPREITARIDGLYRRSSGSGSRT